jgi:hypothetical protein
VGILTPFHNRLKTEWSGEAEWPIETFILTLLICWALSDWLGKLFIKTEVHGGVSASAGVGRDQGGKFARAA